MAVKQIIVFAKEFAERHPGHGFYLRIEQGTGSVEIVELSGFHTMPAARAKAVELGYKPTHHMTYIDGAINIPVAY